MITKKYLWQVGLVAMLIGIVFGVYIVIQAIQQSQIERLRESLYVVPADLPDHILCVGPPPGSEYPSLGADGCYYWQDSPTIFDRNICVALDSRAINSAIQTDDDAFRMVSLDVVDLYVDGEPVNTPEHTQSTPLGTSEWPITKIPNYSFGVPPIGSVVPIHFCWRWEIPQGLHLAEVAIRFEDSGVVDYQWAFKVTAP